MTSSLLLHTDDIDFELTRGSLKKAEWTSSPFVHINFCSLYILLMKQRERVKKQSTGAMTMNGACTNWNGKTSALINLNPPF